MASRPPKDPLPRKRGGRRVAMESAPRYESFGARERVERIVEVLGNNLTAEILHVSKSQPSLWRSGRARVSADLARAVLDLDYVVSRLRMTWHVSVIVDWLYGNNPHVNGRPIDVMILHGPRAVVPALDAADGGIYA